MKEGLVIKSTGSWYYVQDKDKEVYPCKIRGTYRIKGIRATNPVAVGDVVDFIIQEEEQAGVIQKIHPRKNYIIRRSTNLSKDYQLIASNIDQAILMVSLASPKTLLAFIDRFLVSAEAFRIPVHIVFNKIDLYSTELLEEMNELMHLYEGVGYACHTLSLKEGEGVEMMKKLMSDNTSVVSGNSGVGKSTLLNTLDPKLNLKTNEVSESHQSGQHTTTFAEMFELASGGRLTDTPGIKGFGIVDIEKEELFHFFPEIFRSSENCKFNNCMHVNEPQCAVVEDVISGTIAESRYLNYLSLMDDMDEKYRK